MLSKAFSTGSLSPYGPVYRHGGDEFLDCDDARLHPDALEQDGGLCCRDTGLINSQRTVIVDIGKQLGRKLLSGNLDLINITLPVVMFEARSYLQKLADPWVHPNHLQQAAVCSNPLERLKLTAAWFVAGLQHVFSSWRKPFNPILGETWQAHLPSGSSIVMEQVSHHPPVTAFHLEGPGGLFTFDGLSQPEVSFTGGGLKTSAKGYRRITFATDNSTVLIEYPYYKIGGLLSGVPHGLIKGKATLTDQRHGLTAVITFGPVCESASRLLSRADSLSVKIYGSPAAAAAVIAVPKVTDFAPVAATAATLVAAVESIQTAASAPSTVAEPASKSSGKASPASFAALPGIEAAAATAETPQQAVQHHSTGLAAHTSTRLAAQHSADLPSGVMAKVLVQPHLSEDGIIDKPKHKHKSKNALKYHLQKSKSAASVVSHWLGMSNGKGSRQERKDSKASRLSIADATACFSFSFGNGSGRRNSLARMSSNSFLGAGVAAADLFVAESAQPSDSNWSSSSADSVHGGTAYCETISSAGSAQQSPQQPQVQQQSSDFLQQQQRSLSLPTQYSAAVVQQHVLPLQPQQQQVMQQQWQRQGHLQQHQCLLVVGTGNWLSHLDFDGQRYWTQAEDSPECWVTVAEPLPSDSTCRPDLLALKAGDVQSAQKLKEQLEQQQRRDAKLRAGSAH
eukprot:GHRR01000215.1.p1 GENE.GHRR01000215.1~~GHRR01000215.1.p1  ORF type:complete len:681 (+),score=269.84 GHRR01000215.1:832-2874(+)